MRSLFSVVALALGASVVPTGSFNPAAVRDDGRVGVVRDSQGTALVRPVGRERWTPLGQGDVLVAGDQVRTRIRGANAVEIGIGAGGLVLGPGSLIEIPERGVVRLYRGDLEMKGAIEVRGPGDFERTVKAGETVVARAKGRATTVLGEAPRWLSGYRDSTSDEWLGSLVAQVDGRDVPLSVGYHKVTVDVRDQIARTSVEQSFVNSTKSTLEGVFYFPLPADASISGFGMWIGDELVEADIVEKQRARQIYEDILRRRQDPGLLEWSGGNLFKARVFPIFPHSEKRIRIRYTQVLPLQGGKLRYRYALRSELLRSRPLRELKIDVNIGSTVRIREVTSPTHEVRTRNTAHAARIEFDAEEYTPERDFEIVLDLEPGHPLTVVPHRRDDDGYFMLMFAPPAAAGEWQRELLADGDPLDVLLVADTSGSMDEAARSSQLEFTGALLAMLGTEDRFRLMSCDVEPRWLQAQRVQPTEERIEATLSALAERRSLGWTDLDSAFAEITRAADDDTVVVYVGDGIGTTGDADPVALAQRLRDLRTGATFHAVSTAATYEKVVLAAIASTGGGSVRVAGDRPATVALQLLNEVAQPPIKDLEVRFEGLRTARVYPEELPNVAAGTQQVVVGRFLPSGDSQRGRVTVTGSRDGEAVRYTTELVLAQGESGNSFVPRLWARHHVDALLEQGRTAAVAAEIVAFSEEFGIMTPYTSFLVLENDADRERYGVQRRVQMRDGEAFFAEGRDRAQLQLRAQQMKAARTWRLDLRRRMLREIGTLGFHLHTATAVGWDNRRDVGGFAGAKGKSIGHRERFADGLSENEQPDDDYEGDPGDDAADPDLQPAEEQLEADFDEQRKEAADMPARVAANAPMPSTVAFKREDGRFRQQGQTLSQLQGGVFALNGRRGHHHGHSFQSFGFPMLQPAPAEPRPVDAPDWPDEVFALLRQLDRRPALKALEGGVRLTAVSRSVHPLRDLVTSHDEVDGVVGARAWFVRAHGRANQPMEQWLVDGERGVLAAGLRLGRRRAAQATDWRLFPFPLHDWSFSDLVRTYARYRAELREAGEHVTVALIGEGHEVHLTIDRGRGVLVESATVHNGKRGQTTQLSEWVEVAGMWWAKRIAVLDSDRRVVRRATVEVAALTAEAFAAELAARRAAQTDAIMIGQTDPMVAASKQAVHEGAAAFAEHFAVMLDHAQASRWAEAFEAFDRAAEAAGDKPGLGWLRAQLLSIGRRGDELKQHVGDLANAVATTDDAATDFLAMRVVQLASSVFQADETLTLLARLRPAFERKDDDGVWRRVAERRLRAQWLVAAQRSDTARDLYEEIARIYSADVRSITDYLSALERAGDRTRAIELVTRSLAASEWLDYEANQLYQRYTQYLWDRRDVETLLTVLGEWTARGPQQEVAYQRWLSALLFADRKDEADRWIAVRLNRGLSESSTPAARAELGAAIQIALGQGWGYWNGEVEDRWLEPLAAMARQLIREDRHGWQLASRIVHNGRFKRTDEYQTLQRQLRADLAAAEAIESMPHGRLGRYVQWLSWGRDQVDGDFVAEVTRRIRQRWDSAPEIERPTVAGFLLRILDAHGDRDAALAFARVRLENGAPQQRPQAAHDLMSRLAQLEWSEAIETEMVGLLPALAAENATDEQRANLAAGTIRWLSDQLERMRYDALMGPVEQREKLARKELRRRQVEARSAARAALAERWASERDRASGWAKPWFELERLCFAVRSGAALEDVDGETRELFFAVAAGSTLWVDRLLRERCAYVLEYAATRRGATRELADAVVAFLRDRLDEQTIEWREHVFRLLVALDRPEQLAELLREWVVPANVDSRWRVAYGYLMAELGDLEKAVAAFEVAAKLGELGAGEYRVLADWYLARGDEERHERALIARYEQMQEWQLQNRLGQETSKLSRHGDGVPPELDPDVLRVARALLRKATHPAHSVGYLQNLYRTVKDFRVLESLADGVIGHTPAGIYPLLERVGGLLGQVHEEATCDRLAERIAALEVERPVDRRALQLMTLLIERRAAEVLNAPGPHARAGLAAMKSAFRGEWLPGEPRLMASFLASLGAIPQAPFAAEQLRQLRELAQLEEPGSLDRLRIATSLAHTEWRYGRHDTGIDRLVVALDELRKGSGGVLPAEAQPAIEMLISWYEAKGRYRVAETFLRNELELRHPFDRKRWLTQRLFQVRVNCLYAGGTVRMGSGEQLYRELRDAMVASMFEFGAEHITALVPLYCRLHQTAKQRAGVADAGSDLERFGRQTLPELVTLVPGNGQYLIQNVGGTIRELSGPRAALAFLIESIEREPAWFSRVSQSGWQHHAYQLARWRSEAGALGALEARLLRIVLRELERDLMSLQARNRAMYQIHGSWFWREKAGDFAAVTRRVIKQNTESPARLLYAADYLWSGLELRDEAVDVLVEAEARGKLREDGRYRLVGWLHHLERWADSLPLLDALLEMRPDRLDYRTHKIVALHEVDRDPDALALLAASERRLEELGTYNESGLASLAQTALRCAFYQASARLYQELIPLHQRTHANRGVGGGTLSTYYGQLARSFSGLGRDDDAVDAASAAVVAWGRSQHNRQQALQSLHAVIRGIEDLDGYVTRYTKRVAESGLDAPVIRKSLGLVYAAKQQPAKAVPQLIAARGLQPNDEATHQALLAAYDALGNRHAAAEALRQWIAVTPMKLGLYADLAARLAALNDRAESERAWTTLAEMEPNEAHGHRMLATHWDGESRFADAIVQWRQVVRTRSDEPDGWLGLARSQIRARDRSGARKTLEHVMSTEWHERFGDVKQRAMQLLRPLSRPPK